MRMGLYELGDLASFYDGRMGDRRWETEAILIIEVWDPRERVATRRVGLNIDDGSVHTTGYVDDDGDITGDIDDVMRSLTEEVISEMESDEFLVLPGVGEEDWCWVNLRAKDKYEGLEYEAWLELRAVEVEEEMEIAQ